MGNLKGALIIGQSGGPSAVINASAFGVIRTALDSEDITKVYGAHYGITGVINDNLMIMDDEDKEELDKLMWTPSSFLGSCRYKLADSDVDETDYKKILEVFKKHDVRYFCYNGGNDSMDTCNKISKYMKKVGYECRIVGVPKTIDNDLVGTDHCPGYGSVVKYIATSIKEVARDANVYEPGAVTIVECMGRHAGWITAGAALANSANEQCCDLIYLPEVPFDMDKFIDDVKECSRKKDNCMVVVSEGIKYADGSFVLDDKSAKKDAFGHSQLGGLAASLAATVKGRTGLKCRGIELSLLQRSAAHVASATDAKEAFAAGKAAVEAMLAGETDKMIGFECDRQNGYTCKAITVGLDVPANAEKYFPREWINEEGNNVTKEYIEYARPLIEGENKVEWKDGIPNFAIMKRHYVTK